VSDRAQKGNQNCFHVLEHAGVAGERGDGEIFDLVVVSSTVLALRSFLADRGM
jgi:hypothetical protein